MREKAKETLKNLLGKDKGLSDSFNCYVSLLAKELEISEDIAVSLVIEELVNRNEKKLILHSLFSEMTLDKIKL